MPPSDVFLAVRARARTSNTFSFDHGERYGDLLFSFFEIFEIIEIPLCAFSVLEIVVGDCSSATKVLRSSRKII